jgi:hypothetical protein
VCPGGRYASVWWQGTPRPDRRHAALATWREIEGELSLGLPPGPLESRSAFAEVLIPPDRRKGDHVAIRGAGACGLRANPRACRSTGSAPERLVPAPEATGRLTTLRVLTRQIVPLSALRVLRGLSGAKAPSTAPSLLSRRGDHSSGCTGCGYTRA